MFLVMVGGSLGALCRYSVSLLADNYIGSRFPWGTLLANMAGCFLIGNAFALADRTNILSPGARLFFMTGFLGAMTIFSTYAMETVHSLRTGFDSHVIANVLINNLGGVLLVLAGIWLVRFLFGACTNSGPSRNDHDWTADQGDPKPKWIKTDFRVFGYQQIELKDHLQKPEALFAILVSQKPVYFKKEMMLSSDSPSSEMSEPS